MRLVFVLLIDFVSMVTVTLGAWLAFRAASEMYQFFGMGRIESASAAILLLAWMTFSVITAAVGRRVAAKSGGAS